MKPEKKLSFVIFALSVFCVTLESAAAICFFLIGDHKLGIKTVFLVFFPIIVAIVAFFTSKNKSANKFYRRYVCVNLIDERPHSPEMVPLNSPQINTVNETDCGGVQNENPVNENEESANDWGLLRQVLQCRESSLAK